MNLDDNHKQSEISFTRAGKATGSALSAVGSTAAGAGNAFVDAGLNRPSSNRKNTVVIEPFKFLVWKDIYVLPLVSTSNSSKSPANAGGVGLSAK